MEESIVVNYEPFDLYQNIIIRTSDGGMEFMSAKTHELEDTLRALSAKRKIYNIILCGPAPILSKTQEKILTNYANSELLHITIINK